MRKWFAVAQAISDASLALCRSKEKELTELSVGRILQQDEIQLLNEKVKEAETQLKELDAQSQNEDSSSVSTSQPTRKRKKSSRASTSAALLPSQIASSSSQPFPSSTKTANRVKSGGRLSSPIVPTTDPTPSSRKRPRLTSSSISVSTTSTIQRKRSPSVIIVGDSDDEINSKPPVSNKPSPKDRAGRAKKSRKSFVVDDDEPAPTKLRKQGVPSGKDKDKDKEDPFLEFTSSRSKPPSKSSQINKGIACSHTSSVPVLTII
ncbi:uncharacterized protein EV420DRAFT_1642532 [Desarmillaria tabescens]|uniref:Uncharacterized protein n=1 Tax=Armillaria tabescens TaxID=1929756 RepID=A0AA39N5E6_ARMTA|nr:uncharacterized protein EV420DRAFT_1642532 [Desarmillaria tabescens]KAK0458806.1 hypothetical protein EV420DRAFT_1642532 [Desarmillaria tabescens]